MYVCVDTLDTEKSVEALDVVVNNVYVIQSIT